MLIFKEVIKRWFSSPSGDGMVLIDCSKAENYFAFSSPGGVGLFHFTRTILLSSICFRPRVGMGWFMEGENPISTKSEFSSPLGDGLVPKD